MKNNIQRNSAPNPAPYRDTKRFVREFNFPNPDWNTLPQGFPECDTSEFTKLENHLFDAITLAWTASRPEGRKKLLKKTTKATILTIAVFVIFVFGKALITTVETQKYIKPVSAATVSAALRSLPQVSVAKIVESTMSAVFK